jgi:hypothetical protein
MSCAARVTQTSWRFLVVRSTECNIARRHFGAADRGGGLLRKEAELGRMKLPMESSAMLGRTQHLPRRYSTALRPVLAEVDEARKPCM